MQQLCHNVVKEGRLIIKNLPDSKVVMHYTLQIRGYIILKTDFFVSLWEISVDGKGAMPNVEKSLHTSHSNCK